MTPKPKIEAQAVVFDQGNTLLMDPFASVMELQKKYFVETCHNHGLSLSAREIIDEWTRANGAVDYPYIGHFYQEEPIVQYALTNLGVREEIASILGLELLREYRIGLKIVISSDSRIPEIQHTLRELKNRGKRLGVFSNDRAASLGMVLHLMELEPYFEYVCASESVGFEKPDYRVFEHILTSFQLAPGSVVYVGDDPIKDIEAAKRRNLKAIQYCVDINKYNNTWRDYGKTTEYQPDATIYSFSELLDIII